MDNKKGISLISLVITIIVIIILAAIVIFEGFGATESAEFARFTQEFSDYQERVSQEYRSRKIDNTIDRIKKKDSEVYKEIAGTTSSGYTSTLLNGKHLSESLRGTKYYLLTLDKNFYDSNESVYLTDKGEVFTLPGYEYEINGETRYYVTSSKYYSGDGIVAPGGNSGGSTGGNTGGNQEETPPQGEMATELNENDSSAEMWNLLGEIAKVISIQGISSSSTTAQAVVNGKTYNLSVGQEFTVRYNNKDESVRILGFNHDELANTNVYGTTATRAGISFEFVNITESRQMNSTNTNAGSWEESEMRAYLNGENEGEGLYKMDNATKNVIKAVKKPSIKGNYDSANSNWSGEMGTTTDKLWLLSSAEVFNRTISGAPAPQKEGTQYAFYVGKASADRIKKLNGTANWWWLRSPYCGISSHFYSVSSDGNSFSNYAYHSFGVSTGFSI